MSFAGLWHRPSPLFCRPRYHPRPLIIWGEVWEEDIWGAVWEEVTAVWEEVTAAWEEVTAPWEDTVSWDQVTAPWGRDTAAWGRDTAAWDQDTSAWDQVTAPWDQDTSAWDQVTAPWAQDTSAWDQDSTIVMTSRFGTTAVSAIAMIGSSVIAISMTMIGSSAITTVSSSILISWRLASLRTTHTTPITRTMCTRTIIPILITEGPTITNIGTIWPCQCNRNFSGAVISTAR